MADEIPKTDIISIDIDHLSQFVDGNDFSKIINKIADYGDILTETKLGSLINFKYSLNGTQINEVIDLLVDIQALSKILNIASKGLKDLDAEYISNIFSETSYPYNISSYINIRTLVENRLANQTQNYNINMNKANLTTAIPISEVRNHVSQYSDLTNDRTLISSKIQHGMIAASLHDAFILLSNQPDWSNDRTYVKYFFADRSFTKSNNLLITKKSWLLLKDIKERANNISRKLDEAAFRMSRMQTTEKAEQAKKSAALAQPQNRQVKEFHDKMLMTPFGRQYGGMIDKIIEDIFNEERHSLARYEKDTFPDKIRVLYDAFTPGAGGFAGSDYNGIITGLVEGLSGDNFSTKSLSEKYLYNNRKISFEKFFSENKDRHQDFITNLFATYFEIKFMPVFKIIKSQDFKKFACAYIIKRIYMKQGENLTPYGSYLIMSIGKSSGMKA